MTPRIGVALPAMDEISTLGRDGIAVAARRAEAAGLDSVAAPDVLLGDGTVALESMVVLATAAAVTERIALEFGVLSIPTRPVAMLAAQVQSLQHVSGDRVRLGLGIGGFPGVPFWQALEAPDQRRGRLLDDALAVLPALISGKPTALPGLAPGTTLTLAPATTVPPLFVGGGTTDVVLRRVATRADGWIPFALTATEVTAAAVRLRELTAAADRPASRIHLGVHCVIGTRPDDHADREKMTHTLGEFFRMTPEQIAAVTIVGTPEQVAERITEYAESGTDEIGLGLNGRNYLQQLDLLAETRALLGR